MNQQLQKLQANLDIAIAFNKAYPDLPNGYFNVTDDVVQFSSWCYNGDRESRLDSYAKVFGKDGWLATDSGSRIDWSKTILGVTVTIYDAKHMPPREPRPVALSEWPIQLTENSSLCH